MKALKLIQYAGLLLLILCVASCSGQTPVMQESPTAKHESTVAKKEPLNFRITWKVYSGRGEAIKKIVNSYNLQTKDGFEIKMLDGDEDINNISALLDEATKVDIYVLPYRYVKYFGDNGKLLDLSRDFEQERSNFYQNLWNLGMVGDNTYGIPWLGHSIALLYNQNLLQTAGINPERINSKEELTAACEQVEAKTNACGIGLVGANHNDVSWMVNQFIYSFGATLVDNDGKKVAVNNDQAKAAIEFYKSLGRYAPKTWEDDSGVEVMNHFRKQEVAFELQGPWGVTDIWKSGNPFKVGVIGLDRLGFKSEVGPMLLALPTGLSADKKAAALNFMRFLISKSAQEKIMDGEYSPEHDAYYPFRIPVRKDLADSLVFKKYPEFIPFLEGLNSPSIDVPVPQWQKIKDQYYAPGLHAVMTGQLDAGDFLKTVEKEGNKILKKKEQ